MTPYSRSVARPLRIEFPGAWYHVMNRGAQRQAVFVEDRNRWMFLELLAECSELFGAEFHAYCLMGNHYHLVVRTPRGNLSRVMRHLDGVYTQRFNRRCDRDGPLFRGRYKSVIVQEDAHLLQVSRYVHLNPVDAGLVEDPTSYRWSSLPHYLRGAGPGWLEQGTILSFFDPKRPREAYLRFVEEGTDGETNAHFSAAKIDPVLGDDDFRSQLRGMAQIADVEPEIPDFRRLETPPSIGRILSISAEYFGVSPDDFLGSESRASRFRRAVVMALCRRLGGHPLRRVGESFDVPYKTVSAAVIRLERRRVRDSELDRAIRTITRRVEQAWKMET